jgi:hypothetical protein
VNVVRCATHRNLAASIQQTTHSSPVTSTSFHCLLSHPLRLFRTRSKRRSIIAIPTTTDIDRLNTSLKPLRLCRDITSIFLRAFNVESRDHHVRAEISLFLTSITNHCPVVPLQAVTVCSYCTPCLPSNVQCHHRKPTLTDPEARWIPQGFSDDKSPPPTTTTATTTTTISIMDIGGTARYVFCCCFRACDTTNQTVYCVIDRLCN